MDLEFGSSSVECWMDENALIKERRCFKQIIAYKRFLCLNSNEFWSSNHSFSHSVNNIEVEWYMLSDEIHDEIQKRIKMHFTICVYRGGLSSVRSESDLLFLSVFFILRQFQHWERQKKSILDSLKKSFSKKSFTN